MAIQGKLVEAAVREWVRWGGPREDVHSVKRGFTSAQMEAQAPYFGYVHDYWQSIGSGLSGRSPVAWSGAFICFCFKAAGAGKGFPYSDNHSLYCAEIAAGRSAGLTLADPATTQLAPGDLLWASRTGPDCRRPPVTYKDAIRELGRIAAHQADSFCSHSDIVIEVRGGEVDVIGGNVGNAVTRTTYRIDSSGHMADGRRTFIGIVKNAL